MLQRPTLSLGFAGLSLPTGADLRGLLETAAAAGFLGVQPDATATDLRARDLDRSARRDIAALLRRNELALTGLDLLIPPGHFADAARADRALAAVVGGIELAADLARLSGSGQAILCLVLGDGAAPGPEVLTPIVSRAETCGVVLADLGPAWAAAADPHPRSPLGAAIDPASILSRGGDPATAASRAGAAIVQARFSDWSGVARCEPGRGRLDELGYLVALSTAGYSRPLVLDLRGVADAASASRRVLDRWNGG